VSNTHAAPMHHEMPTIQPKAAPEPGTPRHSATPKSNGMTIEITPEP